MVVLVDRSSDSTVELGSVAPTDDVPPSPLFGDVEELTPTSLPSGWARCFGGHPRGYGADETWWSQTFGPVVGGECDPLVTVTQVPPDSPFAVPQDAEDGKLGDADVSQWSDPDSGAVIGLFTWAFDQNLLVEACCGPAAGDHLREVAEAALQGTRQRSPEHCTGPDSDLDREDLVTNLTSKVRRVVDRDGCPIRTDIASMETLSPEAHCYGGLSFAKIGTPFGASIAETAPRTYLRDPAGQVGDDFVVAELDLDAELPATAVDTGYSRDGQTIWIDEGNDALLYVVDADGAEAWPRLSQGLACA